MPRQTSRGDSKRRVLWGALGVLALLAAALIWLGGEQRADELSPSGGAVFGDDSSAALPAPLGDADESLEPERLTTPGDPQATAAVEWPAGVQEITLSGRVIDERGAAWPDAEIVFIADSYTLKLLPDHEKGEPGDPLAHLPRTRSDADGRFALRGPRRSDRARAGTRGRLDPVLGVTGEGMAWQGHAAAGFVGESMDVGDLVLAHVGASFELRVMDDEGAPLQGAIVDPMSSGYQSPADDDPHPPGFLSFAEFGRTDADGHLRVAHRWPQQLWLNVHKPGYNSAHESVELQLGEHLDLGELRLGQGQSHSGRVVDAAGQAVEGATLVVLTGVIIDVLRDEDIDEIDVPHLLFERFAARAPHGLSDAEGRYDIANIAQDMRRPVLLGRAPGFRSALVEDVQLEREDTLITLTRASAWVVELRSALSGEVISGGDLRALQRTGFPEQRSEKRGYISLAHPYDPVEVDGDRVPDRSELGVTLFAAAPGHLPQRVDPEPLPPGEERALVIRLEPAAGVRGRILDERGLPVDGALVELKAEAPFGKLWDPEEQHTDADGRFAFATLPAGSWSGKASKPGHAEDQIAPFDSAQPSESIELSLPRGARVHGSLADAEGAPAAATWLRATRTTDAPELAAVGEAEDAVVSRARADRHGRFEFPGLQPGEWLLESTPGVEEWLSVAAGDDVELELRLDRPLLLVGSVRRGVQALSQVRVGAELKDPDREGERHSVSTRTRGDGSYALELPIEGRFAVTFYAREGPRQHREIDVVRGAPARLDVNFGTAVLAGRARLGAQAEPLARGISVSLRSGEDYVDSSGLDERGGFRFEPLPAGTYTLRVSNRLLIPYESEPIELRDAERREDLELRLDQGAAIDGVVRFADGTIFEGFVHLRSIDDEGVYRVSELDQPDGAYWFESLRPGRYRVDLATFPEAELGRGEGLRGEPGVELPFFAGEEFTLEAGETLDLDIEAQGSAGG